MTDSPDSIEMPPALTRPSPFPWIQWRFSAIFAIALIGLVGTLFYNMASDPEGLTLRIVELGTGQAISGAQVRIGDDVWVSDDQGNVELPNSAKEGAILVSHNGFQDWQSDIGLEKMGQSTIQLRPVDQAIASTTPQPTLPAAETTTAPSSSPGASSGSRTQIDGKIADGSGKGIQGARVVLDGVVDITGKDGLFSVSLPAASSDTLVAKVIAPGYLEQSVEIARDRAAFDVVLEPHKIKAVYLNPNISSTEDDVDRIIEMIDTTELNAVVLDIKEELIYYDSKVDFFIDTDTIRPILDIDAMLKKFHDHDIYVIARLVVFKDSLVAERRPDLAVLNNVTGDLWRDMNGVAWVNPMSHELWEANTDLAFEAAQHGFDEIQFDYVRFPTDGDLETMDFGLENTRDVRQRSIEKFLEMADEKVHPTGAKLSADVFGYTMLVDDDLGIGQNFIRLAKYVDYLSPMIYPSHFPNGSINVDGHPNDFPYETIEISLRLGRDKLDGVALQIRPWLQDFSFFDMKPYGNAEVRAQIDASDDIGTSGWMLWDPNNEYHPGALDPDESMPTPEILATLPPSPVASPSGERNDVIRRRRRRK